LTTDSAKALYSQWQQSRASTASSDYVTDTDSATIIHKLKYIRNQKTSDAM